MCEDNNTGMRTLFLHRRIIKKKGFLKRLYTDFYKVFISVKIPEGMVVELGSGAGFIKEVLPSVITSDVIKSPGIDRIINVTNLPFKRQSISAFLMLDVFHHIKDPIKALRELERCLKVDGKIVMIEPYNSIFGSFIYRHFHHERFDPNSDWKVKGRGRMSDANQALPWIVFVRDRKIFERKFPKLKIINITPHTPLRYIFSGGLSKPQLLPSFTYGLILFIEKILSPFNNMLGLFMTIEIKKTK